MKLFKNHIAIIFTASIILTLILAIVNSKLDIRILGIIFSSPFFFLLFFVFISEIRNMVHEKMIFRKIQDSEEKYITCLAIDGVFMLEAITMCLAGNSYNHISFIGSVMLVLSITVLSIIILIYYLQHSDSYAS